MLSYLTVQPTSNFILKFNMQNVLYLSLCRSILLAILLSNSLRDFKIVLFVFKALNGLAPLYLTETLAFRQSNRVLRSEKSTFAGSTEVTVQTLGGDWAFSVAEPRLWNKLPHY